MELFFSTTAATTTTSETKIKYYRKPNDPHRKTQLEKKKLVQNSRELNKILKIKTQHLKKSPLNIVYNHQCGLNNFEEYKLQFQHFILAKRFNHEPNYVFNSKNNTYPKFNFFNYPEKEKQNSALIWSDNGSFFSPNISNDRYGFFGGRNYLEAMLIRPVMLDKLNGVAFLFLVIEESFDVVSLCYCFPENNSLNYLPSLRIDEDFPFTKTNREIKICIKTRPYGQHFHDIYTNIQALRIASLNWSYLPTCLDFQKISKNTMQELSAIAIGYQTGLIEYASVNESLNRNPFRLSLQSKLDEVRSVNDIRFVQNKGHQIIVSAVPNFLALFDIRNFNRPIFHYEQHYNDILGSHEINIDHKRKLLISSGHDGLCRFWNLQNGKLLYSLNMFDYLPLTNDDKIYPQAFFAKDFTWMGDSNSKLIWGKPIIKSDTLIISNAKKSLFFNLSEFES